jgi:hypothetical protein
VFELRENSTLEGDKKEDRETCPVGDDSLSLNWNGRWYEGQGEKQEGARDMKKLM